MSQPFTDPLVLALIALSSLLMLAYGAGWSWRDGPVARPAGALVKTGSVLALVAVAALLGAPWLALAGGALGALGDWCLARPGPRWFLAGMAVFGAGHLAYVALFSAAMGSALPLWPGAAVVALALSTELWLAPHTGALRWPVRGYVAIICAMLWTALGLPAGPALAGALMFVASDLMLALALFVVSGARLRRVLSLALWPVYWLAQALILLGSPSLAG